MYSTHSQRIERWLGLETVEQLSRNMTEWYGPPIALAGVPGKVFVAKGGDFIGEIRAGCEATWLDYAVDWKRRIERGIRIASRANRAKMNAGFASLSDIIAEASAGKKRDFPFLKGGSTGVSQVTSSLWRVGSLPPGGAVPGNAPGGTAFVDSTSGGMPFINPTGGDTQHFVGAAVSANVASNTLLLYDLLFGCNKTMASTANETVTGVPTRYQNTTAGAVDSAEGNFLFIQVGGTALAATAHNWDTANLYINQAGTIDQALQTVTGVASAITDRLDDSTVSRWFAPLQAGDTGIKALTQMHCTASVATGEIWFMMGHPIAFLPAPVANMFCIHDGINTAFNLTRIFDDACLAFLEANKPSASATTYSGIISTVAG